MSSATADGDFSLKKTFGKVVMGGLKLATIGLIAAVAWQVFLDPLFFPILHDPTNMTAQAWRFLINDWFSWIPDTVGLTGDWGLLQTDAAQGFLEPYYDLAKPAAVSDTIIDGGLDIFTGM